MKSIIYITTTFPTFAWFIEAEVLRLLARGVNVLVFTLRRPGPALHPEHLRLVAITAFVGSPFALSAWGAVLRWLAKRPHILIGEMFRMLWASRGSVYALAGHLGYLPAAARVATEVERHGIERIHGAWAHFPASVAHLAARLTGRRFSMAAHAGADLFRTRAFLRQKLQAADFVVTCVGRNVDLLRGIGGANDRVECVYHGVDLARFDGTDRVRDSVPLLLGVGRLAAEKGFDVAVRALAELAARGVEARLVLAGDGPEREPLERLAASLGVSDRVELTGYVASDQVLALYRRAWVLVAPCRVLAAGRQDGIPNVVVEAMAVGVPCVGTAEVGIPEAIVDGETGRLCATDDPIALADALESLLRSPETLDQMGHNAHRRAAERFDAARNFERVWQLFGASGAEPSKRPEAVESAAP